MSWLEGIRDRVTRSRISDTDIELLLSGFGTGSEEMADLEVFISSLSVETELPRDPGQMATALAATTRSARRATRPLLRRAMALAASAAVLLALSGVAMAADGAVPGDSLYTLDRTLELIGIGDGGVDERIVEFDQLIQRGEGQRAFDLLDEFAETANDADAATAQRHVELAAVEPNAVSAAAQEKVAETKAFIEEHKGDGKGLDGSQFGQGVADRARSDEQGRDDPPEHSATQGPPDQASSNSGKGTAGQTSEDPDQTNTTPANGGGGNSGGNNSDGGGGDGSPGNGGGNGGGQSQNAPDK